MAESKPEGPLQLAWGEYRVPALEGVRGIMDLEGPLGQVYLHIDDGKVTLSPTGGKVDTIVRSDTKGELLRLVSGEVNMVTALLRGVIEAEGDLMLLANVAGSMPELARQHQALAAMAGGR